MNKKSILKFGIIIILGVVVTSAMSAGVLADAPTKSSYSDILNNTDGDGTDSNPYVLTTSDELQAVQGNLSADYVLGNDIDASETEMWNSGAGFTPLGEYGDSFSGSFDGQGFSVDGLYINSSTSSVGLFGRVNTTIKNIGVTNIDIQGENGVGGLVGHTEGDSTITNSYSIGEVSGEGIQVGGLVGETAGSDITNSYSIGEVSGDGRAVGGLVGENAGSDITNSYSTGNVTGNEKVGGLVGKNGGSNITNSYSIGEVSGETKYVGGLVGYNIEASNISKSYSSGSVSGESRVGGLVGNHWDAGTVTDSYWDTEKSNQATSAGSATGLTTSDMTGSAAETNMVGFDFTSVWSTVSASDADSSADSYPILNSVDSVTLSEEEEAVIVSESSSEEYGGMSTLVSASVVAFFGIFIMVVLLFGKD
jgi:hypothetical protein